MPHTLTRQSLYELVWSEPMQSLAKRFALSDRGLAKICAAANVPVPPRGYWAKLQAGKKPRPYKLPPRGLGQSDDVIIGRSAWPYERESDADIINAPVPPTPVFEPAMDSVREQAAAMVRKAPLPLRDSHGWHSQIAKLLAADEERARKQLASRYPSTWDAPIFRTPFEQRRLHILNALFICLTRCGIKAHMSGKHGRDLSVAVGQTSLPFTMDAAGAANQIERERQGYAFIARNEKERMRLSLARSWSEEKQSAPHWEDQPGTPLERRLREIAAAIIVCAEQRIRDGAVRRRAWLIERKAQLQEAERKRREEEEVRRLERIAKAEKARVDHLLAQADALHRAQQIRAYVESVRGLNATSTDRMSPEELESWSGWALAQADRIDPIVSGAFRTRPAESAG